MAPKDTRITVYLQMIWPLEITEAKYQKMIR